MIKARGESGSAGPIIILGLSRDNMCRLLNGQPIDVDMTELGYESGHIMIIGGETEATMQQELDPLIRPRG